MLAPPYSLCASKSVVVAPEAERQVRLTDDQRDGIIFIGHHDFDVVVGNQAIYEECYRCGPPRSRHRRLITAPVHHGRVPASA